jgi:NTE family protein
MSDRDSARIGLACAGGVVEGVFYEVGALCALEEAVEGLDLNALDVYVGVSAGAIVTSCLANGIPIRTLAAELSVADGPFSIAPEQVFAPAYGQYLRRMGLVPATAARAVGRYLASPSDLSLTGVLTELGPLLPCGLFDNRGLERHLARVFGSGDMTNDFRRLGRKLRVVAVNLDTSELVAFGEEGLDHVPISVAVQASTALPLLYCPVRIESSYYIDGVAQRTLNASKALDAGADLVFCINPIVPIDLRLAGNAHRDRSLVASGLPGVLSQTFRTIIHSRLVAGLKNYEYSYPDADVVLIEPQPTDRSLFFTNIFSFSNRTRVIRRGYATTRALLLRESAHLAPLLERRGLRLLEEVLTGPPNPPARQESAGAGRGRRHAAESVVARADRALGELESALARLEAAPPGPAGTGAGPRRRPRAGTGSRP